MKEENVIIIPGIYSHEKDFSKMIMELSKDYKVYFFDCNYRKTSYDVVNDLIDFIREKDIKKTNFVTHSYGSVIFRLFYSKKKSVVRRVVEIAPLNKPSKVLNKVDKLIPILPWLFGKAYKDFVFRSKDILKIKLPKKVGVIAGNKRFNPWALEFYLLPLLCDNRNSDGKILIEETKDKNMKDFTIVHEVHDLQMKNDGVIEKTKDFLKTLKFD